MSPNELSGHSHHGSHRDGNATGEGGPLALMINQVEALREKAIDVAYFNSDQAAEESSQVTCRLRERGNRPGPGTRRLEVRSQNDGFWGNMSA